jgi:hypothetical protein
MAVEAAEHALRARRYAEQERRAQEKWAAWADADEGWATGGNR